MIYLLYCTCDRALAMAMAAGYRQSSLSCFPCSADCTWLPRDRSSFHPLSSRDFLRRQRDGDYKNGVHLVMSALSGIYKNRFCFDWVCCCLSDPSQSRCLERPQRLYDLMFPSEPLYPSQGPSPTCTVAQKPAVNSAVKCSRYDRPVVFQLSKVLTQLRFVFAAHISAIDEREPNFTDHFSIFMFLAVLFVFRNFRVMATARIDLCIFVRVQT